MSTQRIAYYRVSSSDQSIESQRHTMGGGFDHEFQDEGVSGGVLAADRAGFAAMLERVGKGDTLCVFAVDRLGRDAIDVQTTVRDLRREGVILDVHGVGIIAGQVGDIVLAVLAQVADMQRAQIKARCDAGRAAAKASLDATGRTHRGKVSLGRPVAADAATVVAWRASKSASIAATAAQFDLSIATVKRYAAAKRTAKA
jgi:putative DNA-invertase from lambdoid prophage Rac